MEFQGFEKIPRLSKKACVTEKIDGTNGQIYIASLRSDLRGQAGWADLALKGMVEDESSNLYIFAGSRNRWLKPGGKDDNFGFAAWVKENADELFKLGPGRHFGEYWGRGIGRNYGLEERRFSLFNSARWGAHNPNTPSCCSVVPVLAHCTLDMVDDVMVRLKEQGSSAAPGFMDPEGVIVYYERQLYKKTFEHDQGKWSVK